MKALEWDELWSAMDAAPEAWIDTTEHMHNEMLECLPPAAGGYGAFLVGEPRNHTADGQAVYACFVHRGNGHYQAKHLTLQQFRNREGA